MNGESLLSPFERRVLPQHLILGYTNVYSLLCNTYKAMEYITKQEKVRAKWSALPIWRKIWTSSLNRGEIISVTILNLFLHLESHGQLKTNMNSWDVKSENYYQQIVHKQDKVMLRQTCIRCKNRLFQFLTSNMKITAQEPHILEWKKIKQIHVIYIYWWYKQLRT